MLSSRKEIEQFASETYAVAFEDIRSDYAREREKVMRDAQLTGNCEPNLHALTACEAEIAYKMMLAWADAYVDAFTTYQLPCDQNMEADLRRTALHIVGSGVSAVQGEFELAFQRTGRNRNFPLDYVNRQIWARTNSALKKGLLKVKKQRIQFTAQPAFPTTNTWIAPNPSPLATEVQRAMAPARSPRKQGRPTKVSARRNQRYSAIDVALRQIGESRPRTQEEVFQSLQGRRVVLPLAEPFLTAHGWMAGFRRDQASARAWLSKRWAELDLLPLPRGPKNRPK